MDTFECPYNRCVDCSEMTCARFGWNPEVAERRLKKIKEEMMEEKSS